MTSSIHFDALHLAHLPRNSIYLAILVSFIEYKHVSRIQTC